MALSDEPGLLAEPERVRRFIPHEIPLSPGLPRREAARLVLPVDLTQEEADRLCGVIQALALAARPSPVPGTGEEKT
jgi:hypothetical protein